MESTSEVTRSGSNRGPRIAVALFLAIVCIPAFPQNNNDWWRQQQQQQQQQQMQRQMEQQRQQMMEQQRQQMLEQQRRQMQEQQRQQMLEQQRRQMQEQQRQQMVEQQRRQMQEQQRQQMVEQQRRQMQDQQRRQMQDQQRQLAQGQQRRQMFDQQRLQDPQRRQAQEQQQRLRASSQPRSQYRDQQAQQRVKLGANTNVNSPAIRRQADSLARLNRPPTPGEIQRGFTGRVTADGRALIKVRNRIYTVPASRVSGLSARLARNAASSSQRSAPANKNLNASIRALAAQNAASRGARSGGRGAGQGGSGGSGNGNGNGKGGGKGRLNLDPLRAANQHDSYNGSKNNPALRSPLNFKSGGQREHNIRAMNRGLSAQGKKAMIGHHPYYMDAAKQSQSPFFHKEDWDQAERQALRRVDEGGLGLEKGRELDKYMFEHFNRPFLDDHIRRGGTFVLSNPRAEAMYNKDSYFKMEIDYLEKHGYRLSDDGLEMIPPRRR